MKVETVFFDVANTLLHKPELFPAIRSVLEGHGHVRSTEIIRREHARLSEETQFPDAPDSAFYRYFNENFLDQLEINSEERLLQDLHNALKGLEWQPFDDTSILRHLLVPMGIASNWDLSLAYRLEHFFDVRFQWFVSSSEIGVQKPDRRFFEYMVDSCQLSPDQILFIGDSPRLDILPALEFGMHAVLVDRFDNFPAVDIPKITNLDQIKTLL